MNSYSNFFFIASVVKHLDGKLYELMVRTQVDKLLSKERPFTTFISAKYLLDRFNQVENKYLKSPYGFDDLKQMVQYLVISEPVYFDSLEPGETSCKCKEIPECSVSRSIYINYYSIRYLRIR